MAKYTVELSGVSEVAASVEDCPRALEIAQAMAKALAKVCPNTHARVIDASTGRVVNNYFGIVETNVTVVSS